MKVRECSRASSSPHEAEGDCGLSSARVRTRGRRPRIFTARDNFQSRSPSAKCCELYTSLHDRFHLKVRILFYPMRGLSDFNYCWHAGGGQDGAGSTGGGKRGGPGGGGGGGAPNCRETNLNCFMNKLQTTTKKNNNFTLNINYSLYILNWFVFHIHSCIIVVYFIKCYWGFSKLKV